MLGKNYITKNYETKSAKYFDASIKIYIYGPCKQYIFKIIFLNENNYFKMELN